MPKTYSQSKSTGLPIIHPFAAGIDKYLSDNCGTNQEQEDLKTAIVLAESMIKSQIYKVVNSNSGDTFEQAWNKLTDNQSKELLQIVHNQLSDKIVND